MKRFVNENQGMVKRMYGDLRHIFVVKSELDNEINFEDVKNTADKYSQTFNNRRHMKAKKLTVENKNQRSNDVMDKLEQPHFRPAGSKLTTTSSKLRLSTSKQPLSRNESFAIFDNFIKDILDSNALKHKDKTDASSSNIYVIQKSTKLSPTSTTTASVSKAPQVESSTENTTKPDDSLELREMQEIRETEAKVEEILSNLTASIFSADIPETTTKPKIYKKPIDEISRIKLSVESQTDNDQTISESDQAETISDRIDLNSFTKDTDITDNTKDSQNGVISSSSLNSLNLDEVEASGDNKDDKDGKDKNKKPSMTLFQDAVQKEPPVQHNLRGVWVFTQITEIIKIINTNPLKWISRNACPVKEEVVAPFWGNNTRGEVLALL